MTMGAHANPEVHRLSIARQMLEHSYGCLRTPLSLSIILCAKVIVVALMG